MRDVSRILSDADLIKLRELLKAAPSGPMADTHAFQDYPRMLFAPGWVECYRILKEGEDHLVRKQASETMRKLQVIVPDVEAEEEYLLDGWKSDPNEFVILLNAADGLVDATGQGVDPRIPTGREGRRASHMKKLDMQHELANIRRRYAELTGRKLADDDAGVAAAPTEHIIAPPFADTPAKAGTTKQQRVQAATRRATGQSASA